MDTNLEHEQHNKRIIKNTFFLYIRMIIIMAVSLFTSRITLRVLGVEDYGIYNVVGGIVVFLAFLNNTLSVSTQRFFNYEMGNNKNGNLCKVFSLAFTSHIMIAIVFLIMGETAGLWFVNHYLIIPPERFVAALWVYHFSVLTFTVNIIMTPYSAAIIACEKMNIYACVSVLETLFKLGMVYLLSILLFDKLQLYAVFIFVVALFIAMVYFYCCRKIVWVISRFAWDKEYMLKMFSFSGWGFIGAFSQVLCVQGVNVLINMFFNPLHNAARGIAIQLQSAVQTFSVNFMIAVRPQIIKSYSDEEYQYSFMLACSAAKISYFLLLIITLPVILNIEWVLTLWLKKVPEYSIVFTRLTLIDSLLGAMISPVAALSQASGKIKNYQLIISISFVLVFLLTYLFYKWGYASYVAFVISIVLTVLGTVGRVWELKYSIQFPVKYFLKEVVVKVLLVSICCISLMGVYLYFFRGDTLSDFLITSFFAVIMSCLFTWFLGIKSNEKKLILDRICFKR